MFVGRRLLVRAGGDQDRRQPDSPDRLGPPAPAAARTDAARPAAPLRRLPLPHRRDRLPQWFFPQLDNAFGPLWPLILIVAVAAVVFIAVPLAQPILRVLAAAALLTAIVYVFTPLTAAGQEGSPTGLLHQYPLPDAGPGAGAGAAADRAAACAPPRAAPGGRCSSSRRSTRSRSLATPHMAPGLHRRHGLPHPRAGLGAGGARGAAGSPPGEPRRASRWRRRRSCCWRWCSAGRRRSSTSTTTTRTRRSSSGTGGRSAA